MIVQMVANPNQNNQHFKSSVYELFDPNPYKGPKKWPPNLVQEKLP
jgi:hypothetical protein